MEHFSKHLDYDSNRRRTQRFLEEKKDTPKWYSTIFHEANDELNLGSIEEVVIFALIEGLSRGKNVCAINPKKLSRFARCEEEEVHRALVQLEVMGITEKGEWLNRPGWKLTPKAREVVEPIRDRLNKVRARKHFSPKKP